MNTSLETWYRRLIRLYPGGHRVVYAEDMIAVLMAGAQPGQRRPQLPTAVDLLRGAVQAWALRLQARSHAWSTRIPAEIGMLALLMLCVQSITTASGLLQYADLTPYHGWVAVVVMLPSLIWLPVAVAAGQGVYRRPVQWAAWAVGIGWPLINTMVGVSGWAASFLDTPAQFAWLPVALIAAAGLGVDGGARQGFRVLGRTGSIAALAGVVLLGLTGSNLPRLVGGLSNGQGPYGRFMVQARGRSTGPRSAGTASLWCCWPPR